MKIEFFDGVSHIDNLPEYHPAGRTKTKKIKLLDVVALIHDIPERNLSVERSAQSLRFLQAGTRLRLNLVIGMDKRMNPLVFVPLNLWSYTMNRCRKCKDLLANSYCGLTFKRR